MYPTFDSAAGMGQIPLFPGLIPYLILRVAGFDSASGPIPVKGKHCTEEPLVEPFRTAVRAEMAKSGHALHPSICRSDAPELGVVVAACGGHREARCKNEHSCPK